MLQDYDEENNCAHRNQKLIVVHVELKLERKTYKQHVKNDKNELPKKKNGDDKKHNAYKKYIIRMVIKK